VGGEEGELSPQPWNPNPDPKQHQHDVATQNFLIEDIILHNRLCLEDDATWGYLIFLACTIFGSRRRAFGKNSEHKYCKYNFKKYN
jgi:hypothetical protein